MRTDSVWLGVAEGADEPLSPCYTSSSISHMPRTPASAVIVATSSLGSRRERRDQGHGPEFSTSNASGRDVRWSPAPARRDSLRSAGPVCVCGGGGPPGSPRTARVGPRAGTCLVPSRAGASAHPPCRPCAAHGPVSSPPFSALARSRPWQLLQWCGRALRAWSLCKGQARERGKEGMRSW